MNNLDVATVLLDLANGVEPKSKLPLPEDSPIHEAVVIRALFAAANVVRESARDRGSRPSAVARAGEPWTTEEEQTLLREYKRGMRINTIARGHQRTARAIVARLERLGGAMLTRSIPPKKSTAPRDNSHWLKLKAERRRAGRVWTTEEDRTLSIAFEAGEKLDDIAKRLDRGVRAVEVRLFKLGKATL